MFYNKKEVKMKEKLKEIRTKLGKTQKEMSALLGLGEITWQNYERGISKPKLETLKKLSDYGFDINWITSDDDSMLVENKGKVEENISADASSAVNKSKIFNILLNEMKLLYQNVDLSNKEQNYLENRAFDMSMNIASIAQNDIEALRMIKLLVNHEKENIRK